jgi:hypothetical protein
MTEIGNVDPPASFNQWVETLHGQPSVEVMRGTNCHQLTYPPARAAKTSSDLINKAFMKLWLLLQEADPVIDNDSVPLVERVRRSGYLNKKLTETTKAIMRGYLDVADQALQRHLDECKNATALVNPDRLAKFMGEPIDGAKHSERKKEKLKKKIKKKRGKTLERLWVQAFEANQDNRERSEFTKNIREIIVFMQVGWNATIQTQHSSLLEVIGTLKPIVPEVDK